MSIRLRPQGSRHPLLTLLRRFRLSGPRRSATHPPHRRGSPGPPQAQPPIISACSGCAACSPHVRESLPYRHPNIKARAKNFSGPVKHAGTVSIVGSRHMPPQHVEPPETWPLRPHGYLDAAGTSRPSSRGQPMTNPPYRPGPARPRRSGQICLSGRHKEPIASGRPQLAARRHFPIRPDASGAETSACAVLKDRTSLPGTVSVLQR